MSTIAESFSHTYEDIELKLVTLMTSEICICNRRALVLAADSAVTVTRWENGKKEERHFKGANKIFQLSDFYPVGIVIFDTADLHRVPWEMILKDFRAFIGRKKCGGLADYAEDFLGLLRVQIRYLLNSYVKKFLLKR